jgi:hypothetical protein
MHNYHERRCELSRSRPLPDKTPSSRGISLLFNYVICTGNDLTLVGIINYKSSIQPSHFNLHQCLAKTIILLLKDFILLCILS